MNKNQNFIAGITMGCPAGIGPQIILKGFKKKLLKYENTVVFGDLDILEFYNKKFGYKLSFNIFQDVHDNLRNILSDKKINIIDFTNCDLKKLEFGSSSARAGKASLDYIVCAVDCAKKKIIDAVVTCPINKDAIHKAGADYPGHTELLADLTGCDNFGMMLAGKYLRVLLVTTHIGIKEIPFKLSERKVVDTIILAHNSLKNDFGIVKPRIAVLSLNPHCGENGLFGDEEKKIIEPAVKKAAAKRINVSGPFSPDTLFPKVENNFDCVVCMYHDQGLIPLKMLAFGAGVNITLGLPIVRTSVDHGTAYDIVKKNTADCGSLVEAVKTALKISKNRK